MCKIWRMRERLIPGSIFRIIESLGTRLPLDHAPTWSCTTWSCTIFVPTMVIQRGFYVAWVCCEDYTSSVPGWYASAPASFPVTGATPHHSSVVMIMQPTAQQKQHTDHPSSSNVRMSYIDFIIFWSCIWVYHWTPVKYDFRVIIQCCA